MHWYLGFARKSIICCHNLQQKLATTVVKEFIVALSTSASVFSYEKFRMHCWQLHSRNHSSCLRASLVCHELWNYWYHTRCAVINANYIERKFADISDYVQYNSYLHRVSRKELLTPVNRFGHVVLRAEVRQCSCVASNLTRNRKLSLPFFLFT